VLALVAVGAAIEQRHFRTARYERAINLQLTTRASEEHLHGRFQPKRLVVGRTRRAGVILHARPEPRYAGKTFEKEAERVDGRVHPGDEVRAHQWHRLIRT